MSEDAGVACAGVVAVILVDAELESLAVHVVGQRLDTTREPRRVRLQQSAPATTHHVTNTQQRIDFLKRFGLGFPMVKSEALA